MLVRTTHAILGGEKLLWGEAGLGGVSPEISQSTGQKQLSPCISPLASFARIDGVVGPLRGRGIGE